MALEHHFDTLGVVLAGGQSLRMGVPDKCLLTLAGRPILSHVLARAQPQVASLLLSANGDAHRFAGFDITVVADSSPGHGGPMAGIISAMAYASKLSWQPRWLATFPSDAPMAPKDWVQTLRQVAIRETLDVAVAAQDQHVHYTFALWSFAMLSPLQAQYANGERALHRAVQRSRSAIVHCDYDPVAFTNLNTRADLQELEQRIGSSRPGGPSY